MAKKKKNAPGVQAGTGGTQVGGTTTSNVAQFQNKLGSNPCERCEEEPCVCEIKVDESGTVTYNDYTLGYLSDGVLRISDRYGDTTGWADRHDKYNVKISESELTLENLEKFIPWLGFESNKDFVKYVADGKKVFETFNPYSELDEKLIILALRKTNLADQIKKIKALDSGSKGIAYDIGNKVLKITTDKSEADASSLLVGKKLKGVSKFYDVFKYEGEDKLLRNTYVIIQEKLKDDMSAAIKAHAEFRKWFDATISDRVPGTKGISFSYEKYKDKAKEELSPELFNLYIGLMELQKYKIEWDDFHTGNILFRGKMPVIIDLGYSKSPGKVKKKIVDEATVSGQAVGSPSSGGVAGTDTRFGGPSFEPVFFDEPKTKNKMLHNEKTFYDEDNDSVLLPGWKYAADIHDLKFSPEDLEHNELDDEGVEMKRKSAVNWDLDFDNKYKELLRKLRKVHNV